jgi:hypothetical protein
MDEGSERRKEYREALDNASERARWVLLTIVSASIVALAASWNAAPFSWFNQRLTCLQYALETKAWDPKAPEPETGKARFRAIREYLTNTCLLDQQRIENQLDDLHKARLEHVVVVHVPLLGLAFDINDLGFLAGLAFAILLLMFRYSLSTELRALYAALKADPDGAGLLALGQVLTVPEKTTRLWRLLPKLLFWLPAIVQIGVLIIDIASVKYGIAVHPKHTSFAIGLQIVLIVTNIALTRCCVRLSREIDKAWANCDAALAAGSAPAAPSA